jgi:hypothetical protein
MSAISHIRCLIFLNGLDPIFIFEPSPISEYPTHLLTSIHSLTHSLAHMHWLTCSISLCVSHKLTNTLFYSHIHTYSLWITLLFTHSLKQLLSYSLTLSNNHTLSLSYKLTHIFPTPALTNWDTAQHTRSLTHPSRTLTHITLQPKKYKIFKKFGCLTLEADQKGNPISDIMSDSALFSPISEVLISCLLPLLSCRLLDGVPSSGRQGIQMTKDVSNKSFLNHWMVTWKITY